MEGEKGEVGDVDIWFSLSASNPNLTILVKILVLCCGPSHPPVNPENLCVPPSMTAPELTILICYFFFFAYGN